jgi:hypothetical protein
METGHELMEQWRHEHLEMLRSINAANDDIEQRAREQGTSA